MDKSELQQQIAILKDPTQTDLHQNAIHYLGNIGERYEHLAQNAVNAVIAVLQNPDQADLHISAIDRLGWIGKKYEHVAQNVVAAFKTTLQDPAQTDLHEKIPGYLGEIGKKYEHMAQDVVGTFKTILQNPDQASLHQGIIGYLGSISERYKHVAQDVVGTFKTILQNPDQAKLHTSAMNHLSWIGKKYEHVAQDAVGSLKTILQNPDQAKLHRNATDFLGSIGKQHKHIVQDAIEALKGTLNDQTLSHIHRRIIGHLDKIWMQYPNLGQDMINNFAFYCQTQQDNDANQLKLLDISQKIIASMPIQDQKKLEQEILHYTSDQVRALYQRIYPDGFTQKVDEHGFTQKIPSAMDKEIIHTVFETLGLPIPQEGQYLDGVGCNLTFLNRSGLIIKIINQGTADNYQQTLRSDLVLHPLKYVPLSEGAIMILPSISLKNSPIHWEHPDYQDPDWLFINGELESAPFSTFDHQAANIGTLPTITNNEGNKAAFPVIIDHGCISALNSLLETFNTINTPYTGIQERIYGGLKAKLKEVWPDDKPFPDSQKVQAFWDYCAQIVNLSKDDARRVLTPLPTPEENSEDKTQRAIMHAMAYENAVNEKSFEPAGATRQNHRVPEP